MDCRNPADRLSWGMDCRNPTHRLSWGMDCRNPADRLSWEMDCRNPVHRLIWAMDCKNHAHRLSWWMECRNHAPRLNTQKPGKQDDDAFTLLTSTGKVPPVVVTIQAAWLPGQLMLLSSVFYPTNRCCNIMLCWDSGKHSKHSCSENIWHFFITWIIGMHRTLEFILDWVLQCATTLDFSLISVIKVLYPKLSWIEVFI